MLEDFTKGINQSGKPYRRGQDFMGMWLSDDILEILQSTLEREIEDLD